MPTSANVILKPILQNVVVYGIKGSVKISQSKDDIAAIR